jgi:exonuclease-1
MESRTKAEEFLQCGEVSKANRKFNEAVSIDSKMIHRFIQVLKQMSVQFIVAPYEADAQLAYLY